jgi:uncharacterized protein
MYNVHMIKFKWDSTKAASNQRKHGISFEEAKSIFYDECATQFVDGELLESEDRFLMLGVSSEAGLLIVCDCERESEHIISIISARKATKNEGKFYKGGNYES